MKKDVTEVHLAPSVPNRRKKRVERFYQGTGVLVKRIGAAPANPITGGADIHPLDIMQMVAENNLSANEKAETTATANTPGLGSHESPQVKAAYTLAFYIKTTADQFGTVMTPDDFTKLDEALTKLKGLNRAVGGMAQLDTTSKNKLRLYVTVAEKALNDARQPPPPVNQVWTDDAIQRPKKQARRRGSL